MREAQKEARIGAEPKATITILIKPERISRIYEKILSICTGISTVAFSARETRIVAMYHCSLRFPSAPLRFPIMGASRMGITLGCRPNPLEGHCPSNSLLRFAPVLRFIPDRAPWTDSDRRNPASAPRLSFRHSLLSWPIPWPHTGKRRWKCQSTRLRVCPSSCLPSWRLYR